MKLLSKLNVGKKGLEIVVSINIDALHLLSGSIFNYLKKLFNKYPTVKPNNIILEVLETSAIEDIEKIISNHGNM